MPESNVAFELISDFFGSSADAINFMRRFAGHELRIPPMPAVEKMARDRQIAIALKRDPSTATVRRLSVNSPAVPPWGESRV